jgi:hypothetical protein
MILGDKPLLFQGFLPHLVNYLYPGLEDLYQVVTQVSQSDRFNKLNSI